MLPSCGHFKNIPCPFFKLALCVRPHCPYKHQSSDNGNSRQIFTPLVDETESLFDSKVNLNAVDHSKPLYHKTAALAQENATYIPTPVESNSKPPGILKTSNSNFEKASTSFVPEYKPTPISRLKEFSTSTTSTSSVKSVKSEYSPEYPTTVRKKKNVEEYDPTEVKCIPKKTVTFLDQTISVDSDIPIILISSDDDLDDSENAPKFSDDDLDDESSSIPNTNEQVPKVIEIEPEVIEITPEENVFEDVEINEFSVVDKILVDSKKNEMLLKAKTKVSDLTSKFTAIEKQDKNKTILPEKSVVKIENTENITNAKNWNEELLDATLSHINNTNSSNTLKSKKQVNSDSVPPTLKAKRSDSLKKENKTILPEKFVIKTEKSENNTNAKNWNEELASATLSHMDNINSNNTLKSKKQVNSDSVPHTGKANKSDSLKKENKTDKSEKSKKIHKHDISHSTHKEKHKKDSEEISNNKSKAHKKNSEINKSNSKDNKHSNKSGNQITTEHSSDKKNSKKRVIDDHKVKHDRNSSSTIKKSKHVERESNQKSKEPSDIKVKEKKSSKHSSDKRKFETLDSDSIHRNSKKKSPSPEKKRIKTDHLLPHAKKSKLSDSSNNTQKSKLDNFVNSNDDAPYCDFLSSSSESDPDEECRRIFNECYPESSEVSKKNEKETTSQPDTSKSAELVILRKKRFAHPAASDIKKPPSNQIKVDIRKLQHPVKIMFDRFSQCRAKFSQQNENKDTVPDSVKGVDKKRLNFHPNHDLLAAVKNRVNQSSNPALANFNPLPSTVTKTLKVTQRVAHIPDAAMKPRPIIPADFGSKVPANVRQKYLNAFIDECLKFCPSEDEAYDHAIDDEKRAYERSSSKALYMNVAANTLKRLRNQAEEGPAGNDTTSSKLNSKSDKKTVSHETVLNGPIAQRRSFSIGRKRQAPEIKGGAALYEYLSTYILTPEQLKENGFPRPHPVERDKAVIEGVYANRAVYCNDAFKRNCCRCQKTYYVNVDGDYVRDEECDFHWGRLWKKRIAGSLESRYSCCQGDSESDGCCVSTGHVFEGSEAHALKGYVKTLPKTPPPDNCYGIYALDCEMCYTTAGMELTRVTVIDEDLKTVYESFVRPLNRVLDFNTRFSGITEDDLKGTRTTIQDVQAVLLCIFNDKSIIIGHSLESDFKALKLFHNTVVDTSVVFPHKNGLPFKRALRTLMAEKLNKIIQNDVGGHDSHEDAAACMELMLWKVKEDLRGIR